MPSGMTHAATSIAVATVFFLTIPAFPTVGPELAAAGIGCACGVMLTPDLDLREARMDHWAVRRALRSTRGCLSFAWTILWWPYARTIGHRSLLSHMPLVGTLLRLAYFFVVPLFVLAVADTATAVRIVTSSLFLSWVYGLVVSDFLHFLMDWL